MIDKKRRKICIVTGTRAEYGIMSRLMQALKQDDRVELQIIATNMHLSPEFGMTVNEIESDGFTVDRRVEMLLSSDTKVGTVKSMGLASIGFADAYSELQPDLIVILGDRYEMLAAASAALIFGIPVAHLHGGEITEGAYDDTIRHAITKLSYLHFTSTEEYRKRVIQMGEAPERVFWVGSLGVDNMGKEDLMTLAELEESIDHKLGGNFLLVTFHPVTKEPGDTERQTENLLKALETYFPKGNILFTLPNSDAYGRLITRMIKNWANQHPEKVAVVTSLGRERYYSAVALCEAVVGNSSSGLVEVPSFRKPTLNIGNRQKGRAQGNTVINCGTSYEETVNGLEIAISEEIGNMIKEKGVNPYSKDGTLDAIKEELITRPLGNQAIKKFQDIQFELI